MSVNSTFSINFFFFIYKIFFLGWIKNQFSSFLLLKQVDTDTHVDPQIFHVHYEKMDSCVFIKFSPKVRTCYSCDYKIVNPFFFFTILSIEIYHIECNYLLLLLLIDLVFLMIYFFKKITSVNNASFGFKTINWE